VDTAHDSPKSADADRGPGEATIPGGGSVSQGTDDRSASSSEPEGTVAFLPSDDPADAVTLPPTRAAASVCPPAVPGYEILGELGRGGMGVVYQARQTRLRRLVALKMILTGGHAAAVDRERFRAEAESIAQLQHPNIVQIYEVGELDGLPFFSLEYCAGGSLDSRLAKAPLPPRPAAALLETLSRAVDAAHQQGIVHRDLKPGNVLLTADETPKITDFGLAKKLDVAGLTATGTVMGTPSYMAPEQADGRGERIGPATDVYALGAILYACLTGRPPFRAPVAIDTLLQVMKAEPVPPSRLQPHLLRDLETICLKCLEKDPGRRYPTASALADDLRRFQAGEPIEARPVGRAERGWRWCWRNPAVAALATAVVTALLLGTAVASVLAVVAGRNADRADREAALARAAQQNAEHEADAARAARDRAEQAEQKRKALQERAEWLAYAGRLTLAQQEWKHGDGVLAWHHLDSCPVEFRGWEYDYLHSVFNSNQRVLRGYTGPVYSVAYSPDGGRIASAGYDGTIQVWDLSKQDEPLSLRGHVGPATRVAFASDGRRLASAGTDGTLRVWSPETGQQILSIPAGQGALTSVAFSPDRQRLASTSITGLVKVWQADTGAELFRWNHAARVNGVAFSPDGKRLASASHDRTVKVWDVQAGKVIRSLQGESDAMYCLAFSPDGTMLAAANQLRITVWNAVDLEEKFSLHETAGRLTSLAFSPDNQQIVVSNSNAAIKVWDLATREEAYVLKGHRAEVSSVAFRPDGKQIASGCYDATVRVWDPTPREESQTVGKHPRWIHSLAFSPDGSRIASAGEEGTVKVWKADGEELLFEVPHAGRVIGVAYSPGGTRLAGAGAATVNVWDPETGRELRSLRLPSAATGLAFGPDDNRLAVATRSGTVLIWNLDRPNTEIVRVSHQGGVWGLVFSPDGKQLATAGEDHIVRIWSLDGGRTSRSLLGHTDRVLAVCFSRDGKRLASASQDNTVRIWDVAGGRPLLTLEGHTLPVSSVCFSPDGSRLVSGSRDLSVKVWETGGGQEVLSLRGHTFPVNAVTFSPDGLRLASAGDDDVVRIWDARNGPSPLDRARALARHHAHREQWPELAAEMSRILELAPNDHWSWYQAGAVFAFVGDRPAFEKYRAAILHRFGESTDPRVAERTAKACLLLPVTAEQGRQLEQLADRAVRPETASLYLGYFRFARGLAAYRHDDLDAAEKWLRQAGSTPNAAWNLVVPARLVEAMIRQRQGQGEAARQLLAGARQLLEQQTPRPGGTTYDDLWNDYLMCRVWLREAEAMLGENAGAAKSAAP
jgi:WD40 repeat protein